MASMYSIFRRILRETLEDGFFMDGGGRCRGPVAPIRAALRAPMCSPASARIRSANPVCGGALPPICKGQAYRPLRGR